MTKGADVDREARGTRKRGKRAGETRGEPLPPSQVQRFATRRGAQPGTCGGAVENRIAGQSTAYQQTYPSGSQVTGSAQTPNGN